MMYKIFPHILFLAFSTFFMACTTIKSSELKEVTLEERNEKGEIVVTEEELQPKQVLNSKGTKTDPNLTLNDKSEIVTMYDGHGNKTETRYFKGHSRVQFVVVRSAIDKTKQVFVYGFNEETMQIDDKFSEVALNASADEIADAAGLKTTRPFKSSLVSVKPTPIPSKTETRPVESMVQTSEVEVVKPKEETNENENQIQETEQIVKETEKSSNLKQNIQIAEKKNPQ